MKLDFHKIRKHRYCWSDENTVLFGKREMLKLCDYKYDYSYS